MANMGYCRFQNTLEDLQDCLEHIEDNDLSSEEESARRQLIQLCSNIAEEAKYDGDREETWRDYELH